MSSATNLDDNSLSNVSSRETICAVVVTYNRKHLLMECLNALCKQTRPIDAIYLIDNFSNDGTPELLLENSYISVLPVENLSEPWEKQFEVKNLTDGKSIKTFYVRMHENTGGAGGFHEGVKRGYERGYDWLWLMDDDTVAYDDALEKLVESYAFRPTTGFLCSDVKWVDGRPALMNVPNITRKLSIGGKLILFNEYIDHGVLIVKNCSFVSVLINGKVITAVGYPLKEMFIYCDDVEYTLRITKKLLGFFVPASKVVHKCRHNFALNPWIDHPQDATKYFCDMRNRLYIMRKDNYKRFFVKLIYAITISIKLILSKRFALGINLLKGALSSLYFNPIIIYPHRNDK